MQDFILQREPFVVPTTDGKVIEEHFGRASTGDGGYSIARMVAPPGWSEPFQTPQFDEITIMVSGRKRVEVGSQAFDLQPGESILVKRGARVRYSNPFEIAAEYVAICIPAFSIDLAQRDAE